MKKTKIKKSGKKIFLLIKISLLIIINFFIFIQVVNWATGNLEKTNTGILEKKEENKIESEKKRREKTLEELEKEIVWSWSVLTKEELEKISPEKEEDNIVIDAYKTRRQQVFDLIEKSPEEQKINDTKEILKYIKTEKEINQKNYNKLKKDINEFNDLKEDLKNKAEKVKKLEEKENKTKQELEQLREEKEIEKKLNINYKIIATNKQRDIERKKIALEQSKKEIEKNEGLEERYKKLEEQLVKEKIKSSDRDSEKLMEKLNVLYIFIAIIFLLYTLRFLILNHTHFKAKHTKIVTVWELFLWLLIVGFWVWYFFYLFPNLYILIIFLSGYLLLVNAHLIASFMWSLVVVNKYSVWEMVKIWDYLWKIEKIWTIYTVISEIDEKWFMHKNYKYIPNVIIVREWLEKVKDYTLKQRTFSIKLALNKQNTIFKIIDYIKNNILLKHINSRPKHLDPENNDVFEIKYEQEKVWEVKITFFWFSSEGISKKIKSRIIGYIEKETAAVEENNDDDDEKKKIKKEEKKDNDFRFVGV